MPYLIVFLGAGLGGALRHLMNVWAQRAFGSGFPAGTMIVNVAGSIVMGLLAGWFLLRPGYSQEARLFLTTGLLGGFTTFSAFSLDTLALVERGQWMTATFYVLGSVVFGIAGLWLAMTLMSRG